MSKVLSDEEWADFEQQLELAETEAGRLTADNARLRSALRPFANYADASGKIPDDMKITNGSNMAIRQLTMVDCRRAADALKQ